jgi:hypothetical protein
MNLRNISQNDIKVALKSGEIVEDYPDDYPYPSRLILGFSDQRPIHLVVAINNKDKEIIVITVYEPDHDKWEKDLRRRKRK